MVIAVHFGFDDDSIDQLVDEMMAVVQPDVVLAALATTHP